MIETRPVLAAFKPYSPDEIAAEHLQIKIDANEYPEEMPSVVKNKILERFSAVSFNRYPQISGLDLCKKIAEQFGLEAKNVFLGNGSSQILAALCFAFTPEGSSIVYPHPSFSMYGIYAKLVERKGVAVELEADFSLDRDKILKTALKEKAGIIMLCNPNNPTGNVMPPSDIEYIAANTSTLVVVDEAYHEFYGISAVNLLSKYPNLAIVRTFSKAYGLPALRIGYIAAPEKIVAGLAKAVLPYNINALSLIAAETVLSMKDSFTGRKVQIAAERQKIFEILSGFPGIEVFPSETNFLLIRLKEASLLVKHLAGLGISVRDFSAAPRLAGCIRVTIGTPSENDRFLAAVKAFLDKEQKL